jgi:hypothetical protein
MNKIVTLLLTLSTIACCGQPNKYCTDLLYNILKSKPIKEMTDYEYRHFKEFHEECEQYNACTDSQLNMISQKTIDEMNQNEFDYFEDMVFECETINPCKIKQYLEIKNKNNQEYRNNELEFFKECKDDCYGYVDKICGKRRRRIALACLGGALGCIALGTTELIINKANEPSCTTSPVDGIVFNVTGTIFLGISIPLIVSGIKMKSSIKCKNAK